MKIPGASESLRDFTRWNRAGLDRFRYVEGGAAEWLEYLRVAHMLLYATKRQDFPIDDPDSWVAAYRDGTFDNGIEVEAALNTIASRWPQLSPYERVEDSQDYRTALRAQYDTIPIDHAAQLSRAFVRALHILTETLDAYVNEGFLATSTQSPHLRRLLQMIAFRPRLAASATVPIAIVMQGDAGRQSFERGLAAEWTPSDGTPVLTFETLSALTADPGLNLLRPFEWDSRRDAIADGDTRFHLENVETLKLSAKGQLALLRDGASLEGVWVEDANRGAGHIDLTRTAAPADKIVGDLQTAEVFFAPTAVWAARPIGPEWLNFVVEPKSYVGQVVSLSTNVSYGTKFTWDGAPTPLASDRAAADSLSGMTVGDATLSGFELVGTWTGFFFGNLATVEEVRGRDVLINRAKPAGLISVYPAVRSTIVQNPSGHPADALDILVPGPYVTPEGAEEIGELAPLSTSRVHIDLPRPLEFVDGELVALRFTDGLTHGSLATGVSDAGPNGFNFQVTLPSGRSANEIVEVAAFFAGQSTLVHDVRSPEPLISSAASDVIHVISPDRDLDSLLVPGRRLLVAQDPETAVDDEAEVALELIIKTTSRTGDTLTIIAQNDLGAIAGLEKGHAVVYGNVAIFGHGKTLPEQVIGSGDSTHMRQVLELPPGPLSTRPDPGFPGGVLADIEVRQGTRELRQVASADDADPLQPSYMIEVGDNGEIYARFLSRLETGTDDIRLVRHRTGSGAVGNSVPAFALAKPKPKHPAIKTLIQPIPPQRGADLQDAAVLKSQGGNHFALMDRGLSANDFEKLAEGMTDVWHAHAELRREAASLGRPIIQLTVVPSGGGSVGPIASDIRTGLRERSLPGMIFDIRDFIPAPIRVRTDVTLKAGYAKSAALGDAIAEAVWHAFSLERRGLGKSLFVPEITALIEARPEVENLKLSVTPAWIAPADPRVVTAASGAIQAIVPDPRTSVFIEDRADILLFWATGGTP